MHKFLQKILKMRTIDFLSKFLWHKIATLRKEQCIGCQYNHGSQKHHFICMSDCDHQLFRKNALNNLKEAHLITQEEYEYLENDKNHSWINSINI